MMTDLSLSNTSEGTSIVSTYKAIYNQSTVVMPQLRSSNQGRLKPSMMSSHGYHEDVLISNYDGWRKAATSRFLFALLLFFLFFSFLSYFLFPFSSAPFPSLLRGGNMMGH